MTDIEETANPSPELDFRGQYLRDAVVFQGKLLVDGVRDFMLMPIALVATGVDLIKREVPPGRRFYDIVHFGKQTELWIDLFEAADRAPETDEPRPKIDAPSLDEIIDRFEQKLKAEYEKGDISASARQTIDEIVAAAKKAMKDSNGKDSN